MSNGDLEEEDENEGPILNLGSGSNPMPGAVNVDIRALPGVDVVANANMLPFSNGTFAAANAINPYGFNPVSSETASVLQPGSFLYVTGNPSNPYAQPLSASDAQAAGFSLIGSGPMIDLHAFGTQSYTSGGSLLTANSITTIYQVLPP
jgi:hypothetical protein